MFKKQLFPVVIVFVNSIFMAVFMPVAGYMLSSGGTIAGLTFEKYLQDFMLNLALGFLVGFLVPAADFGSVAAKKLSIKNEKSLMFHLIRIFVLAFFMVLFISLLVMFLEIGFAPEFFNIWIKTAPAIFAVVYIYLLFVVPIAVKITAAICNK